MSTEARDEALAEASNEYMLNNGDSTTRNDFIAGALWMDQWLERGQVTPDREAILRVLRDLRIVHGSPGTQVTADAILALFNEKGNE